MSVNLVDQRPVPAARGTLSRRRKLAFIAIAFVVVAALSVSALTALDIYLHHRVQYTAGVNVWGYRGDVVGRKKPGETRIIVLGGSTAFGYGMSWNESWPYYLEQKIASGREVPGPVSVVNLGIPTDSARTFVATLNDYEYLKADVVMFYEGYNDLGLDTSPAKNSTNPAVSHYLAWRHQSPIFRWTGYFPIFPLVLNEKAGLLMHGRVGPADAGEVAFRPDLATRTTAAAMKEAADIGVALERRLGKLTDTNAQKSQTQEAGCGHWSQYCGALEEAVEHALARRQLAVVITQPFISDLHIEQQRALADMMRRRFAGEPRVRYIDLGRLIDLRDQTIAYDGIHLVAAGNERIADALVADVVALIRAQGPPS
jgi:lysophospholipase L1-like esterase